MEVAEVFWGIGKKEEEEEEEDGERKRSCCFFFGVLCAPAAAEATVPFPNITVYINVNCFLSCAGRHKMR